MKKTNETFNKSMLGKWDWWYRDVRQMSSFRYGNTPTYHLAEDFLKDLDIEDWGCGTGGFKRLHVGGYIGIDGSSTPFADKIVDLREYSSITQGIMMRHILEHNHDWEKVLINAVSSFKKRFCIVIFTPFGDETKIIAENKKHGVDVPDISFNKNDIEKHFKGLTWRLSENIKTKTHYGVEHIYFVEKRANIAIVTARLGTNEKLGKHIHQSIDADYYHFNDENYPTRVNAMTSMLQTKIVKMFSWQLVPNYKYYVWANDGSCLDDPDLVKKLLDTNKDVAILKNNTDVFMYKNTSRNQKMLKEKWYFTTRNDGGEKS